MKGLVSFFIVSLGGLFIGIFFGVLTAIITKYTGTVRGKLILKPVLHHLPLTKAGLVLSLHPPYTVIVTPKCLHGEDDYSEGNMICRALPQTLI